MKHRRRLFREFLLLFYLASSAIYFSCFCCHYPHFPRKCCEGFSIVHFLLPRRVDENSDKKSGHELFFSFHFAPALIFLDLHPPMGCDCRLEKLEIIDFECWLFACGGDVDHLGIHQTIMTETTKNLIQNLCQIFLRSMTKRDTKLDRIVGNFLHETLSLLLSLPVKVHFFFLFLSSKLCKDFKLFTVLLRNKISVIDMLLVIHN